MGIDLTCVPVVFAWLATGLGMILVMTSGLELSLWLVRGAPKRRSLRDCTDYKGRVCIAGRVVADDDCDQSMLNGRPTPWMSFWAVRGRKKLAAAEKRGAISISDGTGGTTVEADQAKVEGMVQRRCILAVAEAGAERRLKERFDVEVGFPDNTETVLKEIALLAGDTVVAFGKMKKGRFVGPVRVSLNPAAEKVAHRRAMRFRIAQLVLLSVAVGGLVAVLPVRVDQVNTAKKRAALIDSVRALSSDKARKKSVDALGACF